MLKIAKMRYLLFIIVFAGLLTSCKTKEKEQSLYEKRKELNKGDLGADNVYRVPEIGWTTTIPKGWNIITRDEMANIKKRGAKEMGKVMDAEIDYSTVQDLISVRKDRFNSFMSNIQKFDTATDGDFDERTKTVFDAIRYTYQSKNMKMEDQVGAVRIDGVMFSRLEMKIFDADEKEIILNQEFYIAPINGYDFSMIVNYNNEDDKDILERIVLNSKFAIKE